MSTDMNTRLEPVTEAIDTVVAFFEMTALVAEHPHLGVHLADRVLSMTDQDLTVLIRFAETALIFAMTEQEMRTRK